MTHYGALSAVWPCKAVFVSVLNSTSRCNFEHWLHIIVVIMSRLFTVYATKLTICKNIMTSPPSGRQKPSPNSCSRGASDTSCPDHRRHSLSSQCAVPARPLRDVGCKETARCAFVSNAVLAFFQNLFVVRAEIIALMQGKFNRRSAFRALQRHHERRQTTLHTININLIHTLNWQKPQQPVLLCQLRRRTLLLLHP